MLVPFQTSLLTCRHVTFLYLPPSTHPWNVDVGEACPHAVLEREYISLGPLDGRIQAGLARALVGALLLGCQLEEPGVVRYQVCYIYSPSDGLSSHAAAS